MPTSISLRDALAVWREDMTTWIKANKDTPAGRQLAGQMKDNKTGINFWSASRWADKPFRDMTQLDFEQMIDERRATGHSESSINNLTNTIQRLYTHAKTTSQADGPSGWRWNIHSPIVDARKDRKVKQSEERDRRITMDEHAAIQAVFARMAVERELSIKSGRKLLKIKPTATGASINIWSRDRLMRIEAAYLAALETAMREEKLFLMTWRWIDTSTERWNIVIPKQHQGPSNKNTPVAIAVSPRLKAILKELRGDLPRIGKALDEPVFGELDADYAYRLLKKTCAALSIDDFTWHDLRHEACSRMAADGWTIAQIQRVSGHKTLSQLDRSESVPHIQQ